MGPHRTELRGAFRADKSAYRAGDADAKMNNQIRSRIWSGVSGPIDSMLMTQLEAEVWTHILTELFPVRDQMEQIAPQIRLKTAFDEIVFLTQ